MTKRDLSVSKAKGKWIKRRIGKLLENFDNYNSHQLRENLERIAKQADCRDD